MARAHSERRDGRRELGAELRIMRPVKHASADVVYRGPAPEIGDLWVQRIQPGMILVVYELDDADRAAIAAGGRVALVMHTEPIPPISMAVHCEAEFRPVAEHGWKHIPELADPERNGTPASEADHA